MPPSPLRRTLSAPAVRSSPYPSSSMRIFGSGGRPGRPSSGSSTSSRRVLADLDWWSVVEGQSGGSENEPVRVNFGGSNAEDSTADTFWAAPGLFEDVRIEALNVNWSEAMEPLPLFSALSIAPQTPRRSSRRSSASTPSSGFPTPRRLFADGAELTDVLAQAFAPPPPRAPPTPTRKRTSPPSTPSPRRSRKGRSGLSRSVSEPVLDFGSGSSVLLFNDMVGLSTRRPEHTPDEHPDLFS